MEHFKIGETVSRRESISRRRGSRAADCLRKGAGAPARLLQSGAITRRVFCDSRRACWIFLRCRSVQR